ncbi:PREDICTED: uncharacterized protein LOC104610456 [Nelumbo nucifera]|uniref:Uncharacterized protein LOC104610456 n=2 Tax=Nelumbo nucifera TaxID=4432 RepID=A0A1U8B3L3_NELNU|nr:PREDICTED: uncharacterized protein LOC104610456 [Nelumbo nucifera]DAD18429.1 TPA_asm: hypothetical protein HUJ06_019892 [Nelumbo nucifera]
MSRERENSLQQMGEKGGIGGGSDNGYWWWAVASSAQLTLAISSYRKGYVGDSCFMPFKAFSVASLLVGAGATAVAGFLHASGIRTVEDLKEVGGSIRNGLGIPPREAK